MTPDGRDTPAGSMSFSSSVCGLGTGSRVLEIGPGTGQATGDLLRNGATVTAVELGAEMAAALEAKYRGQNLTVRVGAFEDVDSRSRLVRPDRRGHVVPLDTTRDRHSALRRPPAAEAGGSPCGGTTSATPTAPTRSATP